MKYQSALELMEQLHNEVAHEKTSEEHILIVEHPSVVTMGLRDRTTDMKTSEAELLKSGVDFHHIDRGGSVTIHEPGQLVVYPIVRLNTRDLTVRRLVWSLEESMIKECARWGITAQRDAINPGVWIGMNKVGAVGVRVAQHVSKHGLALNVSNTLNTFSHIVPCGIQGRGVTSIQQNLGDFNAEMNLPHIGERMAADLIEVILSYRNGSNEQVTKS
jgi:lipoate-protein ligase B